MKKMNKKGFTLIEMLVVIAIIAVLVSIIVPVVSNSTTKAAAATNAANLRSVMAEVQVLILEDTKSTVEVSTDGTKCTVTQSDNTTKTEITLPLGKACKAGTVDIAKNAKMAVTYTDGVITASYPTNGTIDNLAAIADGTTK